MAFEVFNVPKEKKGEINKGTSDDLIGRQSISTRDAKALGMEGDIVFLMIEGSDEAVDKARTILSDAGIQAAANSAEIHEKIKKEEESAADGMGMIFG